MDVFAIVVTVIGITLASIYAGYRLAIYQQEINEMKWWSQMTIDDMLSDAPIYNKLSREYGFNE